MTTESDIEQAYEAAAEDFDELGIGQRLPLRFPWLLSASGLYRWSFWFKQPTPIRFPPGPRPAPIEEQADLFPTWFRHEELRLDVDGRYPQMMASGMLSSRLTMRAHWIANLVATGPSRWTGPIWYRDGNTTAIPYTDVEITAKRSWYAGQRSATVRFTGGGSSTRTRTYKYESPYFHDVEFEFDAAEGTAPVTQISTGDHPNRPTSLPVENLSIEKVYRRAGFKVVKTSGDGTVPLALANTNAKWSDTEMHDAMQTYWSRFASKAQWSMWVFFAGLHERGSSLGGIMFDDIGPNHRQGTALFNESFINTQPAGDPAPAAFVERMKFWTACHEMGHAFNLAHSWQKEHPPDWGTPWIPLTNEPEARSYMNYPYNVSGGSDAFFADFEHRFSDNELIFMRHAPSRFVQMGNADWFENHGFEQAAISVNPSLRLEARVNREHAVFDFLEPAAIELKLTNVSDSPQLVDEDVLRQSSNITVVMRHQGRVARRWVPYAHWLQSSATRVLNPGESVYETVPIATGQNGWDVSEPGVYVIQAALHLAEEDVVSNPLLIRVSPPSSTVEEQLAQPYLSDDVGRTLAFGGSIALTTAVDTLREIADQLPDSRAALHARLALGGPPARSYKRLEIEAGVRGPTSAAEVGAKIVTSRPKVDEAVTEIGGALLAKPDVAAETFGHVHFHDKVDQFSEFLDDHGSPSEAADAQATMHKSLSNRGVLDSVLSGIDDNRAAYDNRASEMSSKKRTTKSSNKATTKKK